MKMKFPLTGILLICCSFCFGQYQKNDFKAGMTFRLVHDEHTFGFPPDFVNPIKSSGFNFTPSLGLFITNHFELGLGLGFGSSKYSYYYDIDSVNSKSNSFSTVLFGNQYFSLGDNVSFFLATSVNLNFSSYHIESNNLGFETNGFGYSIGIAPGISVTPVKKLMISVTYGKLGFSKEVDKDKKSGEITSTQSRYGIQLDTNTFTIGIHYIF